MGHASREAGSEFEKRIKNALVAAQQAGIVEWWAHQQPVMTFSGKYVGQSGADFVVVLRGGLAGAIECKSVKGYRLLRDAVAPEQTRHLDAVARAGGLALLAAEFRDEETGMMFQALSPWRDVPWKKARTREAVAADDLEKWKIVHDGAIAKLVRKCDACGSYEPTGPVMTRCCTGGLPF